MAMTRDDMDMLVDKHFRFEATDDVDGVMRTLAPEAEHEVIPSPFGPLRDRPKMRAYHEILFGDLEGHHVSPVRRLYGDGFLIDETEWTGHIRYGRAFLCDGKSGTVTFRLLHVFELRDGLIMREQAWVDLAAIQRQLEVGAGPSTHRSLDEVG